MAFRNVLMRAGGLIAAVAVLAGCSRARYQIESDDIFVDTVSGTMFDRNAYGGVATTTNFSGGYAFGVASLEEGQKACAASRTGGFSDWHVPTGAELAGAYLVDAQIDNDAEAFFHLPPVPSGTHVSDAYALGNLNGQACRWYFSGYGANGKCNVDQPFQDAVRLPAICVRKTDPAGFGAYGVHSK